MSWFIDWISTDIFNSIFLILICVTAWLVWCSPKSPRSISAVIFTLPAVLYYYLLPTGLTLFQHYAITAAADVVAVFALGFVPNVTITIIRVQVLFLLSMLANFLDAIFYATLRFDTFEVLKTFFVMYYFTAMAVLLTKDPDDDDGIYMRIYLPSSWIAWSDRATIATHRCIPKIYKAKQKR